MDISSKIKSLKAEVSSLASEEKAHKDRIIELRNLIKEIEERKAKIKLLKKEENELLEDIEGLV